MRVQNAPGECAVPSVTNFENALQHDTDAYREARHAEDQASRCLSAPNTSTISSDAASATVGCSRNSGVVASEIFNISAEWSGWMRQLYAKVLQSSFGTGV